MKKRAWMPEGVTKQLDNYEFALKHAREYVGQLNSGKAEWQRKLEEQAQLIVGNPEYVFSLDRGWECSESPIGVCVYENHYNEWCIFCGDPEERK